MIAHVRPPELATWLTTTAAATGRAPVVLDVREGWELEAASVKPAGFALLTIPMGDVPARLAELDPATPVACLCHHGARSLRVAGFLAQNGFGSVANITGGIEAWSAELDPTVPTY
jgi:rhodanese-related sulfurtransferase